MTADAAFTFGEMAALMTVNRVGDLGAIRAAFSTFNVITAVTISAVDAEHALTAIRAPLRLKRVWVTSALRSALERF